MPLCLRLVEATRALDLLVIVPAWNEEASLRGVLRELKSVAPEADVVVVNDGSTDGTARVVREAGTAMLIDLPLNLGVGGAMRAGYRFAQRNGYQRAVQVDGDGQHDPAEIGRLLALLDEGANLAIGARFAGAGSYRTRGPRRWAMAILSTVLSGVTRTKLTDTTSGFRACDRHGIELFATDYPAEYLGDTVEALVIAHRAGLTIRQVGVKMRARAGGAPSQSPIKAAVFLGRAALALLIAMTRPMASRVRMEPS